MRKSAVSGGSRRPHNPSEDGIALVAVLGAIFILLMVASGVARQAMLELKASSVEPDVAQRQLLIWSGLQEAAQQVRTLVDESNQLGDPSVVIDFANQAPDPASPPPPGWAPCEPAPSPAGKGFVCTDYLRWRLSVVPLDATDMPSAQFPVAIRWKLNEGDAVATAYGWVVTDVDDVDNPTAFGSVWVYNDHSWCRPNPAWTLDGANGNFCLQGG